jgi:Putative beta-barrel porin-2, OmpL-like. bbp2
MTARLASLNHCGRTIVIGALLMYGWSAAAQQANSDTAAAAAAPSNVEELQKTVSELKAEVSELKAQMAEMKSAIAVSNRSAVGAPGEASYETAHTVADVEQPGGGVVETPPQESSGQVGTAAPEQASYALSKEDRGILDYFKGTTTNVMVDAYYAYNFNDPIGRVNVLRAYDVLSNAFSLNQAAVVFEHAADPSEGRRWGTRLDLQFGQATATLQGSPANEHRPDIYRNIFQAYGTYVFPVGSGLTVDFGKWASSLGYEGNYTKDQMNYSRAYWFNFLPFYHMGFRMKYQVNSKLGLNYWLVNGTNQTEPTNGFKDEMFGFVLTPTKQVTWTTNYYFGQDNPDSIGTTNCPPVPVQPGLCFVPITPAPNGKLHIFDSYVNWQAAPKWTLALEGDYVVNRMWANSGPGQNSAPAHTWGGAGYVEYQLSPKGWLAARGEYLEDRGAYFTGGLFSNVTEALKEFTVTYGYNIADGLQVKTEYRYDWSNVPVFLTSTQNVYSKDQSTATLGLIWWFGRKQGAW